MEKLSTAPFRAAKKTERKVSKGKDKETYPGYFSNPLRSARACVRVKRPTPTCSYAFAGAVLRLVVAGKDHLVPTLLLIAENRDDREKSLQQMPRRSYFRHRDELLDFFVALQCTYDLRGRDCGEVPQRQSPPQRKQDKKGTEP